MVTLVAQWATKGQEQINYGLGSADECARRQALLDAQSVIQQCLQLQQSGIDVVGLEVHVGQRCGGTAGHAVSLHRSLLELRGVLSQVLPFCRLGVEITDSLPADHATTFPAAKKAALTTAELVDVVAAANSGRESPVGVIVNWGRLLINGDEPLRLVEELSSTSSATPLAGVILSGAEATENGFADAHNSHLDPKSGFSLRDAEACAQLLTGSAQPTFIGMKCSGKRAGASELKPEEVLAAQAEFLADC